MKIQEAIAAANARKPNQVSVEMKIRWLSVLDGRVEREIFSPGALGDFRGYAVDTAQSTELKIPYPYDEIYPLWLEAHIAQIGGETEKYNNALTMCEDLMREFRAFCLRTRRREPVRMKFF